VLIGAYLQLVIANAPKLDQLLATPYVWKMSLTIHVLLHFMHGCGLNGHIILMKRSSTV
jgi:hypothetical protein